MQNPRNQIGWYYRLTCNSMIVAQMAGRKLFCDVNNMQLRYVAGR